MSSMGVHLSKLESERTKILIPRSKPAVFMDFFAKKMSNKLSTLLCVYDLKLERGSRKGSSSCSYYICTVKINSTRS